MSDWRDGYDAWKLATPPEYESEQSEISMLEEDAWRSGWTLTRAQAVEIVARRECQRRGIDPDEACADGGVLAWMVVGKELEEAEL